MSVSVSYSSRPLVLHLEYTQFELLTMASHQSTM